MSSASAMKDHYQRRRQQEALDPPLFIATLEGVKTPEQVLLEKEQSRRLERLIDELKPPRLGLAVRYRYGIGCEPMTLDEVGAKFNVTKERVRQIIAKGERILRRRMLQEENPKLLREMTEREEQEQRARGRVNAENRRLEQEVNRARHEEWLAAHGFELEQQREASRAAFWTEYKRQQAELAKRDYDEAYREARIVNAKWDDELRRRENEKRLQAALAEQRRQDEKRFRVEQAKKQRLEARLEAKARLSVERAVIPGGRIMKPERKTALTFEEKIIAAHLHYVQGVDQHVIAFAMSVNMGRVNEACMAVKHALQPVRAVEANDG